MEPIITFKIIDKRTGQEADVSEVYLSKGGEPAYRNKVNWYINEEGSLGILDSCADWTLPGDHYEAVAT